MPRIGDVLAIAGGEKRCDAKVDTGVTARRLERVGGHLITGQDEIPATTFPLHRDRLHNASNRAMPMNPDLANALQVYTLVIGEPAAPVAVPGPFHRVEPATALEPWIARRMTCLDAMPLR